MRAFKPSELERLLEVPGNAERLGFAPSAFVEMPPAEKPTDTKAGFEYERELEVLCENWLRQHDIYFIHLSPRAREKAGIVDLIFCIDGKPFACELKSHTGKTTGPQRDAMTRMAANGWTVAVVRSWEQFISVISPLDTTAGK
jgi:hypothetical protein